MVVRRVGVVETGGGSDGDDDAVDDEVEVRRRKPGEEGTVEEWGVGDEEVEKGWED